MVRELTLATIVCAAWLTICFLCAGATYGIVGKLIGLQRLLEIEGAFGVVSLAGGVTSISRVSMLVYGLVMLLATLPINLYWLKRLRRESQPNETT